MTQTYRRGGIRNCADGKALARRDLKRKGRRRKTANTEQLRQKAEKTLFEICTPFAEGEEQERSRNRFNSEGGEEMPLRSERREGGGATRA